MKTIGSIIFLTAAAALLLAGCSKDKPTKPTTYTVTVTSTDGGTAHAEPTEAVEGATITLTAAPNDGYDFEKWTVIAGEVTLEGEQADLVITFTMPAENVEIMAEFMEDIDIFTLIVDDIFREYCSEFDTNGDGKLSRKEAQEVKEINTNRKDISSLEGIEHFSSLESLVCSRNSLTSLDVSKLTALTTLNCSNCQLKTLDISKNTELTTFKCVGNQLTTLDLSKNTALTTFSCSLCQLNTLDVSKNVELTSLSCSDNQFTSINVSSNTKLTEFDCSNNKLTSLDVNQNTALELLYCYSNRLTVLDASTMTFDKDGKYTLWCGMQKTATGGSQTLRITLRDDMKEYWNTTLRGSTYNTSVTLAN